MRAKSGQIVYRMFTNRSNEPLFALLQIEAGSEEKPTTYVANRHFIALDSWRGVCALLVAIGHLKTTGAISMVPIFDVSYRLVDFFFVLSGFVILHSTRDELVRSRSNVISFIIRRIGRLWPLHVALLIGFLIYETLLLAANHSGLSIGRPPFTGKEQLSFLPANILMIQAWNVLPSPSWNVPAWSISAEFAAYLVFAACFTLLRRRGIVLLITIGLISATALFRAGPIGSAGTYDYGVPRCLFAFSSGALVHYVWRSLKSTLSHATYWEVVAVTATFTVTVYCPENLGPLIVPVYAATILVFCFEKGFLSKVMTSAPGRFLGSRSYSIYMTHSLFLTLLLSAVAVSPRLGKSWFSIGKIGENTGIVAQPWVADILVIFYVGVVLVASNLTFKLIEEPWRKKAGLLARAAAARFVVERVRRSSRFPDAS